jgi:hypothetical protein
VSWADAASHGEDAEKHRPPPPEMERTAGSAASSMPFSGMDTAKSKLDAE